MKLYRKINRNLALSYPLIWKSRVLEFIVISLLFNVLCFVTGYCLINLDVLRNQNVGNYYFRSNFVFFHVIFCIILISLWAFFFYRNRALKNFYPLSKGYLFKLSGLLFLMFFSLGFAYVPFQQGVFLKTRSLFEARNKPQDVDLVNIASAFLPESFTQYDIYNRNFPAPFPLEYESFDKNYNTWSEFPAYDTTVLKQGFFERNHPYPKIEVPDSSVMTVLNGNYYVFYTTRYLKAKNSSCYDREFIDRFYVLDSMEENSILYYSDEILDNPHNFERYYAPRIKALAEGRQFDSIGYYLQQLRLIYEKYEIPNTLNEKLVLRYLRIKDFKNLAGITSSPSSFYGPRAPGYYAAMSDSAFVRELQSENNYALQINEFELKNVFQSYYKAVENSWFPNDPKQETLVTLLFTSLILTAFFLLFEFTNFISLVISIPVLGVMLIASVLFIVFYSPRSYGHGPAFEFYFSTIVAALPLVVYLILLYSKKSPKFLLDILMNAAYFTIPFILPFLAQGIYYANRYTFYEKCQILRVVEPVSPVLVHPLLLFCYALTGMICFILLLKKWVSKAE